MRRFRYHYYHIHIPSDFSRDKTERAEQAITEAREQARLYIMPCTWQAMKDENDVVTVRRISNKPE